MTLHSISAALVAGGGSGLHGDAVVSLAKALGELQRLKVTVVTGNQLADVNLTLTGIATTDTIVATLEQDSTSGVLVNHAGTVTVTAASTIQSSAVTTGKNLVVVWFDKAA